MRAKTTPPHPGAVQPDQVWQDWDTRTRLAEPPFARYVRVLRVSPLGWADCETWRGGPDDTPGWARRVRIMLRRFRPNSTGYRLVSRTASNVPLKRREVR